MPSLLEHFWEWNSTLKMGETWYSQLVSMLIYLWLLENSYPSEGTRNKDILKRWVGIR